ncbi:DUF2513 domain-containing protein [Brucella gallinifaecis]|nr:DUF2513 domain-containing protein [Brucella gallinifaecis]
MKFEIDLLRDLLIYVEENAVDPWSDLVEVSLEGWTPKEITYHVILAEEAGLIKAWLSEIPDAENPINILVSFSIQRLTFNGHELLGSIREPKHWQLIKKGAKSAGIGTVGALGSYIQAYVKAEINKRFGLDIS